MAEERSHKHLPTVYPVVLKSLGRLKSSPEKRTEDVTEDVPASPRRNLPLPKVKGKRQPRLCELWRLPEDVEKMRNPLLTRKKALGDLTPTPRKLTHLEKLQHRHHKLDQALQAKVLGDERLLSLLNSLNPRVSTPKPRRNNLVLLPITEECRLRILQNQTRSAHESKYAPMAPHWNGWSGYNFVSINDLFATKNRFL